MNLEKISDEIKRPLILDGAMGSLLQQRNVNLHPVLWASSALLTHPQEVLKIHKEYISSGCDIITTNTFRTNPHAVNISGVQIESKELAARAIDLAKNAKGSSDIIIAGSNAPAEDCYQREVTLWRSQIIENHKRHIEYLLEGGVDFILNETHSHLEEIKIVCDICSEMNAPFVISLFFDDNLNLLSGETLNDAVELVLEYSPLAVGFNCVKPEYFRKYYSCCEPDFNWGFYLNCGKEDYSDNKMDTCLLPQEYVNEVKELVNGKTLFIGACCGSNPKHINELRRIFDEKN